MTTYPWAPACRLMSSSSADRSHGLPPWAHVSSHRREHIAQVASLLDEWATRLAVSEGERHRWLRAAYLHDALKDAPGDELAELAGPEWPQRKLRHGPAAARKAEVAGETDGGVLDAVRYHSVGFAPWDQVGRMLYLADYLEPGRPFSGPEHADWMARVPTEPDVVLREVTGVRMARSLSGEQSLLPQTVAFWNSLV